MLRWLVFVLLTGVAGCAPSAPPEPFDNPLLFDPERVAQADTVVIMIPGAMTSIGMFAPVLEWAARPGVALAFYRFPGMHELPVDPPLKIARAGRQIAGFANSLPGKRIRLLGYSTGGPIAIMAGQQIEGDLRIAALSSAVERAGGITSAARIAGDVAEAAYRARSVRPSEVWLQYYRTLLVGRKAARKPLPPEATPAPNPDFGQPVTANTVKMPQRGLPIAQSRDILRWKLPPGIPPMTDRLRFYAGKEDPVFATGQTVAFARKLGSAPVFAYAGHGHLIYMTHPQVFEDIFTWFTAE